MEERKLTLIIKRANTIKEQRDAKPGFTRGAHERVQKDGGAALFLRCIATSDRTHDRHIDSLSAVGFRSFLLSVLSVCYQSNH